MNSSDSQNVNQRRSHIVTVFMALVAFFGSFVALLQNQASILEDQAAQIAQSSAVSSLSHLVQADEEALFGLDLLAAWQEANERMVQASGGADALRLVGEDARAEALVAFSAPWQGAVDAVEDLSPLFSSDYDLDYVRYYEDLHRESYLSYEIQQAALREADQYGNKADAYVSVLSMVAAILLLLGLSLSVFSSVRYIFIGGAVLLTSISTLWVLWILVQPLRITPPLAMEHFADGQVASNIAFQSDVDLASQYETDATRAFDRAIQLDGRYANAYEQRGLTLLQQRLLEADAVRNSNAADDLEQAIRFGNVNSVIYANLGWAYFLAGNYESSISASNEAINIDSSLCIAHLNRELAQLVLGSSQAYALSSSTSLDCLINTSGSEQSWLFEAALTDLHDLEDTAPETLGLDGALRNVKELWASITMMHRFAPRPVEARLSAIDFAEDIGSDGTYLDVGVVFVAGTPIVYTVLYFEDMQPDNPWMIRWYHDNVLFNVYVEEMWQFGESGNAWVSLPGTPLPTGEFTAEFFVAGNLLGSADFQVLSGDVVDMIFYPSSVFELELNVPRGWVLFEDTEPDPQLFLSFPDDSSIFFRYTSYPGDTDGRGSLEELQSEWELQHDRVRFEDSGNFYLGGLPDARYRRVNFSENGVPFTALLMITVDETGSAHEAVIQGPTEDFDELQRLYFNPMIRSLQIGGNAATGASQ